MNPSSLNLSQDLPNDITIAINIICELTGEDVHKISPLPQDKIYDMLSFLLKCEKDKLKKLFREHDENQEIDTKTLQIMWKLLQKGVIKAKKRSFTQLDEKVDENIRITFARIATEAMVRAENPLGPTSSSMASSIPVRKDTLSTISIENLQKFLALHNQQVKSIANSNTGHSFSSGM